MAIIRRNPRTFVVALVAMLAACVLHFVWPRTVAQADQPARPLAPADMERVATLRHVSGLDDDAVASLNPIDAQVIAAVTGLRSWFETHQAMWVGACTAVADQRARVRLLRAAIDNGQDQASALASAEATLAQLQAELDTQSAALRAAASTSLSENQRALLERMYVNRDRAMPFRILDLTAEQRATLARATTDYQQRLALARDAQARAALATGYAAATASAIGPSNMQLLAALDQYRAAAAARLVAVMKSVFPA